MQQLLLKNQDKERKVTPMSMDTGQQQQQHLKSQGFPNPTTSPPSNSDPMAGINPSILGQRKRPSDDGDDGSGTPTSKRMLDEMLHATATSVSSTGPTQGVGKSALCQKNKMLASLLAKEPTKTSAIPPVPASIITATPQEKLPRVLDPSKVRPGGELPNYFTANCTVILEK